MSAYAIMSYPPSTTYDGFDHNYYGLPASTTVPSAGPAYPPPIITMPQPQHYHRIPHFQQASPYPFDQPSPAYTSPAYTPGPHIMQYLSPPPSSQVSPVSPYDQTARPSRGRAVVIGINYFNQKGEMKGRVDEAKNLSRYLQQVKRYRKEDIILLSDEQNGPYSQPTKKNILSALIWLAKNARPGEKLILYYSGHGRVSLKQKKAKGKGKQPAGRKRSSDGTTVQAEGDDEMETIYPVDFRSFKDGMITPEDLDEILKPAKDRGAKLTIILDTHAGMR